MIKRFSPAYYVPHVALFIALFALIGSASAFNHKTEVIKADVTNIEPIYMNYSLQKVSTPCASGVRGCWEISYQKKAAKVLKGYRVKLSYKNNTFTARMQNKPADDYLNIRVKSDLLVIPSTVAINAAVVY
ncbi:MAG: hypothetical protein ISR70_02785 [Candidatus Thioglobus sp.]|nr:hypothetical protein [Candidatus Thioglobus pontius]MBL6976970.1 hypothetical protein [Candidatus Thioglobus sp.]MBL6984622.1 hypothetical protein [Candidatus Thioglobus sp.]